MHVLRPTRVNGSIVFCIQKPSACIIQQHVCTISRLWTPVSCPSGS